MSSDKTSVATVHLPFPSLDNLKASLSPLLSNEGLFVETNFPPPLGTPVEMILVVGDHREEVARFRAQVMSYEPENPLLQGKKGVQLRFHKLFPNAQALFATLNPVASSAKDYQEEEILALSDDAILTNEEVDPGAETAPLSETDIQRHLQSLAELKKASESERQQRQESQIEPQAEPQAPNKSLVDDLEQLTHRPDISGFREVEFEQPKSAGLSDDFSNLQGRGGYEMSDVILGIDLGTCYSCVAVMKDDEVKVLPDEKGFTTTPSVVSYLEDGTVIVGREAVAQMAKNPRTSIFGAKRFIGRGYHSPIVQNMIRFFPYKLVPDSENHTAIDIFGKAVSLEAVSAEILKTMRNIAHDAIGENSDKVIVTVPAYYSDNQRQAVKDAGVLAGLQVIRIINEPTSAALAVGFNQKMQKRILVYDLGGGTFDVSILDIKDNSFQVIATGGDTFLGGEDFDNRLVKWVLESSREEGVQLARNPVVFERLKQSCEKAKCELSTKKETSINLPYIPTVDGKTINFQKPIDRERLVSLTRDLVEKSVKLTDDVLAEVKLTISDVDEIVLVGGMTRMPFVRNLVHQHYAKKPFGEVNPDEAVAMGAAILGGEMTGSRKVSLSDVLSMSIGIALPKNRFKPILMKNSAVPCQKKYKITADLSQEFTIDVFQGESQKCDDNEYLGTLVFSDEVKGSKSQSLEIEFDLNNECLLNCIIRNPTSGKAEKALLITHDTPPSAKLA